MVLPSCSGTDSPVLERFAVPYSTGSAVFGQHLEVQGIFGSAREVPLSARMSAPEILG